MRSGVRWGPASNQAGDAATSHTQRMHAIAATSRKHIFDTSVWLPAAVTVLVLVTITVRGPLVAAGAGLGLFLAAALVRWASVRLLAVVAGALLVFQSDASAGKYVYLGLAATCCALSAVRIAKDSDPIIRCFRPMIVGGGALAVMLAVSVLVARAAGATGSNWVRDALPYVLLVALPMVGIDAGHGMTRKRADFLIGGIGVIAATGFALDWLDRRGVSSLGVGRVVLASAVLAGLSFAYALAHADAGWRAVRWIVVASTILALLLVTGTRTNIIFVVAFVGVAGRKHRAAINPIRMAAYVAAMTVGILVVVPALGSVMVSDPEFLRGRTQAAISTVRGEAAHDQSYVERQHSYQVTKETFEEHRWLGAGPGTGVTADSPWVVPAKFGIVGTLALVLFFGTILVSVRRIRTMAGPSPAYVAGRGWLLILVALTPFGPWTEDKGMALALTLLLASIAAQARPRNGVGVEQVWPA